jgi:integrase
MPDEYVRNPNNLAARKEESFSNLRTVRANSAELHNVVLRSRASAPTLTPCAGDANSTATRRKSMSRRIIVAAGNTKPEIRQRGYVYQKGRKQSDAWVPTERAYGFFRKDVPGQTKQVEVRCPLGFCRDRMSAMFKLHQVMQEAGVLDVEKIRERITPVTTFESQAAWWLAEIKAGRIVNKKTRKLIRPRTIDSYSTLVGYLNGVVRDEPLASLDNPEAKGLVARMKAETVDEGPRFSDKTICTYFKVFTQVIASAKDDKAKQVFPREWDLAYIALPMVCQREQRRPTLEPQEVETILSKCKRPIYRMVAALLAGTGIRISELLALEIGKHISAECTVISIRQQRGKWGGIESAPKTEAGFRDIDLCPRLAKMLRNYIGDRKSGFLFETETGKMLGPANLGGMASLQSSARWGGKPSVSMRSGDSVKRSCRRASAGNSSSIIGWDTRTRGWQAGMRGSWWRTGNSGRMGRKGRTRLRDS